MGGPNPWPSLCWLQVSTSRNANDNRRKSRSLIIRTFVVRSTVENKLLICRYCCSIICIFLITNRQPLISICVSLRIHLPTFRQPHPVQCSFSSWFICHLTYITSSHSLSLLSSSITPSVFHSRLKT